MEIRSGVFKNIHGFKLLACVDDAVLHGRRDSNFSIYINKVYKEYAKQMNIPYKDHKITFNEIISNLHINYRNFDQNNRYVLQMDSLRRIFFEHIKNIPKQKQQKLYDEEIKQFNLRTRNKVLKTKTIISESTNVNSEFSTR